MTTLPQQVTIIEVGPRDGLQNEPLFVPTAYKIELINQLSQTGIQHIEVTSFVSAKAIPQLADNQAVFDGIRANPAVVYSALVPNTQGLQQAIASGTRHIAIFTAASEQFNQRNIHCSIADSMVRSKAVIHAAKLQGLQIRAYISCALGCPYEGEISPQKVLDLATELFNLGVDEISLGDTIGVGTPRQTQALIETIAKKLPLAMLAMHFHDTYGQAIANIYASLQCGVTRFDSSVAGLGGCPYARGASGNVATEDVLYLMHGLNIDTGIDIYKVVAAGDMICNALHRLNQSKVANALMANKQQR